MSGQGQNVPVPRILVVEDEHVVAMDMEMQLVASGYEVTGIAAAGKEALRLAETTRPDLILMDVRLQGPLDGFATAAEIQRVRNVPIVFVTAFGNGEAKRRAKELGPYGLLTKPYRPEDLRSIVTGALARDRSR
jgi:CheY-like chemotaxis protein